MRLAHPVLREISASMRKTARLLFKAPDVFTSGVFHNYYRLMKLELLVKIARMMFQS